MGFPTRPAGKHIAKRHLTGYYSSASTIWLVLLHCLHYYALCG